MQRTERNRQLNKARYDVLSIPGYIIEKNPTHGDRHGPSVRQCMYNKAHDMLRKARTHKSGGWHNDDKYRKSLSDIGWTEEQIIEYDEIALEDHSYVAAWEERSRNEKSWKKIFECRRYLNIHQSLEMETNQSLLHKSGNGLINNLKASKNTITDLNLEQDGDKILPPGRRIHLRHHTGNTAATGRQNRSIFSSLIVQRCHFACRKFNLLAIDRGV